MVRRATQMIGLMIALAAVGSAHEQAPASTPKSVVQAFEHYEMIRAALAADKFADVAAHATQLAALVEPLGGAGSKKSADALVAAKNIEEARTQFGELSTTLVPVFQAAAIPGTTAFMCPMKSKPWIQKGDKVENPYYGKAMLTCGSPLTVK